MNKEYVLKVIAGVIFLIILFLCSGGIYEYQRMGQNTARINKFTNSVEAIEYNMSSQRYYWIDITAQQKDKAQ